MTIEYALTRTEVARSYLKSLSGSPQFRLRIFVIAAVLAGFHMMLHAVTTHSFASGDIVGGVIVFAIVLAALPVLLFLMAKRDKRSLTIGPEGISTRIGSQSGNYSLDVHADVVMSRGFPLACHSLPTHRILRTVHTCP